MYLHALSTAVPPARLTQAECWDLVQRSDLRHRLQRKSLFVLRAVLTGDSGVGTRHFAAPDIEKILHVSADELNAIFRREAPALSARALAPALEQAGARPDELDALFICTCTGYLCPGVTSYVAEQLGLKSDAYLQDLVGLGCGAAIPTLRAAQGYLAANPQATVATVAVEICSAAFYLDDDLGVLFSACLFGDGAAAAVWRATPGDRALRCHGFDTVHRPEHRDRIRFEQKDGRLRNLLHESVPGLAAEAVHHLLEREIKRPAARPIERILSHSGGRDVLRALEKKMPGRSFRAGWDILREYGNMSSPTVLFALHQELGRGMPSAEADWWLVSFGAGFSAHSCRIGL